MLGQEASSQTVCSPRSCMMLRSSVKFGPCLILTLSHSGRRCGRAAPNPGASRRGAPRRRFASTSFFPRDPPADRWVPPFEEISIVGSMTLAISTQPAYASLAPVSYTHLRAHETDSYLVCRL